MSTKTVSRKSKAYQFTAENATVFSHTSDKNRAIVESARECSCEAYQDIFTYQRWQAQGFQVQKGEKGTRIATYRPITKVNEETGEEEVKGQQPVYKTVFCRCQVKPATESKPKISRKDRKAIKTARATSKTARKARRVNVTAA